MHAAMMARADAGTFEAEHFLHSAEELSSGAAITVGCCLLPSLRYVRVDLITFHHRGGAFSLKSRCVFDSKGPLSFIYPRDGWSLEGFLDAAGNPTEITVSGGWWW